MTQLRFHVFAAAALLLGSASAQHWQQRRPVQPPQPLVRATLLKAKVAIRDGIATTELVQTLHNDGGRDAEATWILPLPKGATADRFTMTVGGKEMEGEVLDPNKARRIYEDIVRRRKDPGLLEYAGHGCLRARVFPIPPRGSIDVNVRYRQILPHTAGLHTYEFPLRAAGIGGKPAEKLTLDLTIHSRKPIKNVYSPLTSVDIVRKGEHDARVSLELAKGQVPERDLTVFYGLSEQAFGLDLLTWRKAGEPGHLLMLLSPQQDWPEPKNTIKFVQFILDTSGSMQGEKIEQARDALRFFVNSLKPGDRFNIIPFSTEARPFFTAPAEFSDETKQKALSQIDELVARGGTNIEDALRVALAAEMPATSVPVQIVPITVFLTDGLPTVGTTDVDALLKQVENGNDTKSRVFVFGVGNDVNTQLLDKMAAQSRGDRDYVREHEDIEVKTAALFTKLSNPVLTDIELITDGIELFDQHPKQLPDLFKGSRLMLLGRYQGDGHRAVRLKGKVDGSVREYVFEASFPTEAKEHDFVPTLWAQRKIAVLLDAIRLNGKKPELVQAVQQLGKEYGIVTPFTSHLIIEEGMTVARRFGVPVQGNDDFFLGAGANGAVRLREELERSGRGGSRRGQAAPPPGTISLDTVTAESRAARQRMSDLDKKAEGKNAVDNSVALLQLQKAAGESQAGGGVAGWVSQRIGGQQYYLLAGKWVDRRVKPEMVASLKRIEAFSKEYFELLAKHPELNKVLAFSTRLVLVVDGAAIEIY